MNVSQKKLTKVMRSKNVSLKALIRTHYINIIIIISIRKYETSESYCSFEFVFFFQLNSKTSIIYRESCQTTNIEIEILMSMTSSRKKEKLTNYYYLKIYFN